MIIYKRRIKEKLPTSKIGMKTSLLIPLLLLPFVLSSYQEKREKKLIAKQAEVLDPYVNVLELEDSFLKWWTYHFNNISLSSNFIAFNENLDSIEKGQFLTKLSTGEFIPLRLKSKHHIECYKLHKLDSLADNSIGITIRNEALTKLKFFNMEGKPFPDFHFKDLNGTLYTKENTKGKTLIIKTWFINCKACVAEFPELNALVQKHENRKDIIFVSLARDSKAALDQFLQKKNFKYQVVPEQIDFIVNHLGLNIYPTHIMVDKNGIVLKVCNEASEIIAFLEGQQ